LAVYTFFKLKENKSLFSFFVFWLLINIASYAAYLPTNAYETTNRLLAHSFVALIGIFIILAKSKRIFFYLIIFWGLGNLVNSYNLQKSILLSRSLPAKEFYSQLKQIVPKLEKGDILYFDIADSNRQKFSDAFSVAQMPEETAIAWQYSIDRYDIRRFTEYADFKKTLDAGVITDINKEEMKINNAYSFFYSDDGLVETTGKLHEGLRSDLAINGRSYRQLEFTSKYTKDGTEVEFESPIDSVTPMTISIEISAVISDIDSLQFPLKNNQKLIANPIAKDEALRLKAFNYQANKDQLLKRYKINASSIWKEDFAKNLADSRKDTYWRADRVLWSKEGASFTIDLGAIQTFDRLVWLNGYANNTPSKYTIETSLDNKNWKIVFDKTSSKRVEPNVLNVDKFDSVSARYVRMTIQNTLSNDSASIAEVWIVPNVFEDLDITKTEEFIESPLGYVPSKQSYISSLSALNYFGDVQVYWLSDKSDNFQTQSNSILKVKYDNLSRSYNITVPAGGTKIFNLELNQLQIGGILQIKKIYLMSR
jgi:hypothetical protein